MFCRTGSRFPTGSLLKDLVSLGSFCQVAAAIEGDAEPVNAALKGPDYLSPCVFSKKVNARMAVIAWKL